MRASLLAHSRCMFLNEPGCQGLQQRGGLDVASCHTTSSPADVHRALGAALGATVLGLAAWDAPWALLSAQRPPRAGAARWLGTGGLQLSESMKGCQAVLQIQWMPTWLHSSGEEERCLRNGMEEPICPVERMGWKRTSVLPV